MNRQHDLLLLTNMLRIRRLEELCAELYTKEKIRGFLHLYIGEEAIAAGVMSQVKPEDNVIATYREHGHALLKGIPAKEIMAEMYGKETGCSRGRGGSMHLFSKQHRFYGGQAIVAAGLPQACGLALAAKYLKEPRLTYVFFGDGAVVEGEFHEAMNIAALWRLPIIFCCENNQYAMGTAIDRYTTEASVVEKAKAYKIAGISVDGMCVDSVVTGTRQAVLHVLSKQQPILIEFTTYRFRAHSMFDPELYRSKEEVQLWKQRCPIEKKTNELRQVGLITEEWLLNTEKRINEELMAACEFAESSPNELHENLKSYLYAPGGSL